MNDLIRSKKMITINNQKHHMGENMPGFSANNIPNVEVHV